MFATKSLNKISLFTILSGISVFSVNVGSSQAQQASISGAASYTSGGMVMENFDPGTGNLTSRNITGPTAITTVSGESILPAGLFFQGNLIVTPAYGEVVAGTGINGVTSLSLGTDGGVQVTPENTTFSRAAAQTLTNAAAGGLVNPNLDLIIGIIRAGAGVNGLD